MTSEATTARSALRTVGATAALGASVGAALGYWIATILFSPSGDADTSLAGWIFDNGYAFAAVLIPLFIGGALIGWIALPALVGKLLNWDSVGQGAAYQVMLGAIGLPASIWLLGSLDGIPDTAFAWISGTLFVLVAAGIPTLSRLLAVPRHLVASPATWSPPPRP